MHKHVSISALTLVLGAVAGHAARADCTEPPNLVVNQSFECDGTNSPVLITQTPGTNNPGQITGWKLSPPGGAIGETATYDPFLPGHSGYLAICTEGTRGIATQTITTTPGKAYNFSFTFSSDGAPGSFFQARWGNQVIMEASSMDYRQGWQNFDGSAEYEFVVTATSTRTMISFRGEGGTGASCVGFDDVSVTLH